VPLPAPEELRGCSSYRTAPLKDRPTSSLPWEGSLAKKPWEYRITATLAVLDPADSLEVVVDLLRAQTERPYVIIVDTGSEWDNLIRLNRRFADSDDVEVHSIRSRAWRHSSAPVGASLDLALATCHTRYLYTTHDDVFLKRRDYLEELVRIQEATQSVAVGYEMSSREWLTSQWRGMVSHTATLFDVPTLLRIGASWSFERSHHQFGVTRSTMGWPDTETSFGLLLNALGMKPHLIGHETNYEKFEDHNLVHCRSFTGSKLYGAELHKKSLKWVEQEVSASKARLLDWGSVA
jgi:hypothetical protein